MPKVADKKPPQAQAPPPQKKPAKRPERMVVYPALLCNGVPIPEKNLILDAEWFKKVMGWETETEYCNRLREEERAKGKKDVEKLVFALSDEDVLTTDFLGEMVAAWHNAKNRDFDRNHCLALSQDFLNRKGRFNGEAIILGKTGLTLSLQHRGAAVIFAEQRRTSEAEKDHWAQFWDGPVTFKSIVIAGIEEDFDTVSSLDNVKPRSEQDVLMTSDVFARLGKESRRECSKMLATAIDLLWRRTNASEDEWHEYKTHSTSMEFLEHHAKLKDCVTHLFEENKDRLITKLRLSAGKCAALMYLMASSTSDIDDYRNADPRSEKQLRWDNWEKAEEYYTLIGSSPDMQLLRDELDALRDEDTGVGGTDAEKQSLLVKGWAAFLAGGEMTKADLELEYQNDKRGHPCLVNPPLIGGIDQGIKVSPPDEPVPTPEQVEEEKAAVRKAAAKALADKLNAQRGKRAPGEVPAPEPITYDADGKPPPLKKKSLQEQRTEQAKADDAAGKVSKPPAAAKPPTPAKPLDAGRPAPKPGKKK